MRIGHGYDVHKLIEGRKLILGGIEVPHTLGLLGHSDADVLTHAVMDALLGAAALGDIGQHFPDNDDRYLGADSTVLLGHVMELIREKGITLEMCPTSNRQTHAIPDMKQYPLVRFLESGICVTVNTDDMGIERTCLSKEFDYLKREFGLTEEQQKQAVLNAADAAFASEETKKMLREKILKVYGASL